MSKIARFFNILMECVKQPTTTSFPRTQEPSVFHRSPSTLLRWLWRHWLLRQRREGEFCARVLLVGSARSIQDINAELRHQPEAGYRVLGACAPGFLKGALIPGTRIPVVGDVKVINRAMTFTTADTVVVTSTDELPADEVKQISWNLEPGKQHLVLAPSIADISGPRIHTRQVAGLPLVHVETPQFSRGQRMAKRPSPPRRPRWRTTTVAHTADSLPSRASQGSGRLVGAQRSRGMKRCASTCRTSRTGACGVTWSSCSRPPRSSSHPGTPRISLAPRFADL